MRISSFLKLVEIQTKLASQVPLLLGTVYAVYRFGEFKALNFFLLFLSLLAIDMATTAINNYFDYKRAQKKCGYNYEHHNVIVRDKLGESSVVAAIIILLAVAVSVGLLLFIRTDPIVLILGAISFCIGILYSFGPVPISRTPLGEVFSGLFMGCVIVFLSVYAHVYDRNIISFLLQGNMVGITFEWTEILSIFGLSVPLVVGIANIMLANNICDMEDDMANKRYTLPLYIGCKNSIRLFKVLYYIAFIDIIVLVVSRIISPVSLLALLVFIPVRKNIMLFEEKQSKKDTFVLAVKNFMMIGGAMVLGIFISVLLKQAGIGI